MHHLASSSGRTHGRSASAATPTELEEAMKRAKISSGPISDETVQQLAAMMNQQMNVSGTFPANAIENVIRTLLNTTVDDPQEQSKSTHSTLSSSLNGSSTDVEFSIKDQPAPVRPAYSSDSNSSRGVPCNENYEPGNRYAGASQSSSVGGEAAILNQPRGRTGATEEKVRGAEKNRDVNGSGIGLGSCSPMKNSHKRTPSRPKERHQPKRVGVFPIGGAANGYIKQNETNVASPTAQYVQQQQQQPLLSRIMCGKSQRGQDFEYIDATRGSSSGPSLNNASSSSNSVFQFNPSFSTMSPVNATHATEPAPARRTQTTLSPRPGLQENEDQGQAISSPAVINDRSDKKPSPRPAYPKHSGDDDGAQQPSAPRGFPSHGREPPTPFVQTVNSQTSASSTTVATPFNLSDDSPVSIGATTPMDFSPTAATPAPLGGFEGTTTDTPFAETPRQKPHFGATPFFGDPSTTAPTPLQQGPPTVAPNMMQQNASPLPPVVDPGPPVLPTFPVQTGQVDEKLIALDNGTRSRRGHKKIEKARIFKTNKAVIMPKAGGHALGVSSSGSDMQQPPTEQPRIPSPMEGVQKDQPKTDVAFQLGHSTRETRTNKLNRLRAHASTGKNRFNLPTSASKAPSPVPYQPSPAPVPDSEAKMHDHAAAVELLKKKREEARDAKVKADYRVAIECNTTAITTLLSLRGTPIFDSDLMAALHSNRASALCLLGAFGAAVYDCERSLSFMSDDGPKNDCFTKEVGPSEKVSVQKRLARSLLRQGFYEKAQFWYREAIQTAQDAIAASHSSQEPGGPELRAVLEHLQLDASLGLQDCVDMENQVDQIEKMEAKLESTGGNTWKFAEPLVGLNRVMNTVDASLYLLGKKLSLLIKMKRWREAAGVLERHAALNVKFDGVFTNDLVAFNPFPGVPKSKYLTAEFFDERREEDHLSAEKKLSSKATPDAILRMPYRFTQLYLRALRLQERYPAAVDAIKALESLVKHGTPEKSAEEMQAEFKWLPTEKAKLERTQSMRKEADDLYKAGEFAKAADVYAATLLIDSGGRPSDDTAGGRLHAVVHCNRTASLMALGRAEEALDHASAAIRIHPRYMKAILRRGRCYARLMRFKEAISEFNRWLELVQDAKKGKTPLHESSPCLFDGPGSVTDADIQVVRKELTNVSIEQRRADAAVRETQQRREQRQQQWNAAFRPGSAAQQRRDDFYNNQADPRRWDSFKNSRPRPAYNRSTSADPGFTRSKSSSRSHSAERGGGHSQRQHPVGSPGGRNLDHYTVLGVSRSATVKEIEKAYRSLAKVYHPDKNPGKDTTANFHAIREAHEVLRDTMKRQSYDLELRHSRRI